MADPTQYSFELQEVAEALVSKQGLTTGRWTVSVEFNFTAIMAGQSPTDVKPTAMVQINRLQLVQVAGELPPGQPIVDASKIGRRKVK